IATPNEVLHRRMLKDKLLAACLFSVDASAQQDAGVADNEPAGLENQFTPHRLDRGHNHLGESIRWQGLLFSIMNAESATHVHGFNGMPLIPQLFDQDFGLFQSLAIRLGIEDRRA